MTQPAFERDDGIVSSDDPYGRAKALIFLGLAYAQLDVPERAPRSWTRLIDLYPAPSAEDDAEVEQVIAAALDRRLPGAVG